MRRRIVRTDKAPRAIGPYSQANVAFFIDGQASSTRIIFCSGQIAIDPKTGELVKGNVGRQTRLAIKHLESVLKAEDATLRNVHKTTVFMVNLEDFARMNEIYKQYFPDDPPARSTVQVSGLPKGALVEIEAIAVI